MTSLPLQFRMSFFSQNDARMHDVIRKNDYIVLKTLAISCLAVFLSFMWQGNKGLNLWDEGYLWYGAQRVLNNEIPIRDFLAYDPGRYYWSATIMSIFGDAGIMSLRAAVAVFQAYGLFVGMLLITSSEHNKPRTEFILWLIAAATFMVWMFPRHKLFDISISLFLIGALTYLIKNPTARRYFIAGVCVGVAAIFGRNHGMYGAIACLGVFAWFSINSRSGSGLVQASLLWAGGVVVGFLPVILMILVVPGFSKAFWESIRFLLETKSTNLPLPVPWPWLVDFTGAPAGETARSVLVGLFFMAVLIYAIAAIAWVTYCKVKAKPVAPAFVASAFLALPYAHFAFSRADIGHLAQGIFPLLVGCMLLFSSARSQVKWPLALTLVSASFWVMHVYHPGWQCHASTQCVTIEVSGKDLEVDSSTAHDVALLRELSRQYAQGGKTFIATPVWPGAYALLERKSPMWEIYAILPRPAAFEEKEIERIKAAEPGFALVIDLPLDGRDDLRFKNTHPLIQQYIAQNYLPVPFAGNAAYRIFKSKDTE